MNQSQLADELLSSFLQQARTFFGDVEPVKVLRSNTYRVGNAHVLARVAADTGKYFFGLNYINAEEVANLENAYVAFVCGGIEHCLIVPINALMPLLPHISHDRNGEFKINITHDFELALKGRGKRHSLASYLNNWESLKAASPLTPGSASAEQSFHTVLQGRLIEIGNNRGLQTYSANKSKTFNSIPLQKLTTLEKCPTLQFANYETLRNIDVVWFRETGSHLYPHSAFEIELSTGIWSGVGRLATLREYTTSLVVVSSELKRFDQVMQSQPEIRNRFRNVLPEHIGVLYMAESRLRQLRQEIGV